MGLIDTTNKIPLLDDKKVKNKFLRKHNQANVIGELTVFGNGRTQWGKAIDHDFAMGFKVIAKQLTRSRFRASAIPQKQKRRPMWWSPIFEAVLKDAIEKKQKELSAGNEREYSVAGGRIQSMRQGNQFKDAPSNSVSHNHPDQKGDREKLAH